MMTTDDRLKENSAAPDEFIDMEDAATEEKEILASEVRIPDTIAYYREIIIENPVLTPEQEIDFFVRYQEGDMKAREKIILSNLRLVISIAGKYKIHGFDLNDLIQEGILGLEHALKKFDLDRGNKFSTYATAWIKKYVSKEINGQKYIISMPQHAETDYRKILKAREHLNEKLDREPTIDEIYEKMQGREKFRKTKIKALLNTARVFSLDAEDDEENGLFSPIISHKNDNVENIVNAKNRITKMREIAGILLSKMKLNDAMIIKMYYGLNDARELSVNEIAEIWGLSSKAVKKTIAGLKTIKEKYIYQREAKEVLEDE